MYCGAVADGSVIIYHATGTILIRRAKVNKKAVFAETC